MQRYLSWMNLVSAAACTRRLGGRSSDERLKNQKTRPAVSETPDDYSDKWKSKPRDPKHSIRVVGLKSLACTE